jgi:HAE1 family hydrophobic/amphiphilic exporter-1
VRDGTEEPRSAAAYAGREAIGIDIKKSKGYSTTDVSDRIRARVAQIQERLPAGTKVEVIKDAGVRVDAAVANVQEALIEGALLTVLVVFLFLNSWRSTVITGLALPVSVLASFIAVWLLGFKLETMSLLGLSLAIGILIDDAIVVRENIVRHVEMGKDHYTAARDGTDEIGLAVAATTFSILAVFVPIGFMPGIGGQWFKPFALTDRVLGARLAVRVVLARPDAVGLLARPARTRGEEVAPDTRCSTGSTAGSTARQRATSE